MFLPPVPQGEGSGAFTDPPGQTPVPTDASCSALVSSQVSYFEIYLDKIRDLLDGEMKGAKDESQSEEPVRGRGP